MIEMFNGLSNETILVLDVFCLIGIAVLAIMLKEQRREKVRQPVIQRTHSQRIPVQRIWIKKKWRYIVNVYGEENERVKSRWSSKIWKNNKKRPTDK